MFIDNLKCKEWETSNVCLVAFRITETIRQNLSTAGKLEGRNTNRAGHLYTEHNSCTSSEKESKGKFA